MYNVFFLISGTPAAGSNSRASVVGMLEEKAEAYIHVGAPPCTDQGLKTSSVENRCLI